ncbi:MAG: family 16 glycosylhydrolase [Treponema sp.]|nr:family 16 glycosylhydrolase [Treponema sp.]
MKLLTKSLALLLTLLMLGFVSCKTDDNTINVTPVNSNTTTDSNTTTNSNPDTTDTTQSITYTITFEKNASDAVGVTESISSKKNSTVTLTECGFTRSGYKFIGWNTTADGKGANYSNKATFPLIKNLTLYAVWTKEESEENTGGTESGTGNQESGGNTNPATPTTPTDNPSGTPTDNPTDTPVTEKTVTNYLFSSETGASDLGAELIDWGNGGTATTTDVSGIGKALLVTTGTGWGSAAGCVPFTFSSGLLRSYDTLSFKLYVSDMTVTNPTADKDIIVKIPEVEIAFSLAENAKAVSGKNGWYEFTIPLTLSAWETVRTSENRIAILQRCTGSFKITDIALSKKESSGGTSSDSGNTGTQGEAIGAYRQGMTLVWQDEFNSAEADGTPLSSKWHYDVGRGTSTNSDGTNPGNWGWGNGEEQWYSDKNPNNTYVSDGTLKIVAKREAAGNGATWTSGRLVTRNLYENKYGCIEMRAKISEAAGVWPAFWMLRHDIYDEGGTGWPRGGEIDIMESSTNIWGAGKVFGTLHCQAGYGGGPIWSNGMQLSDLANTWHTYAVVWNEAGTISWYYDDTLLGTYTASDVNNNDVWPYDENFYIILNLAVGGNLGGQVNDSLSKATMEVDYVRWYK